MGSERLRLVCPPHDWTGILGGQVENSGGVRLTSPGAGVCEHEAGLPAERGATFRPALGFHSAMLKMSRGLTWER